MDMDAAGEPTEFYEMDVFEVKDVKKLLGIKVAPSIVM